MTIWADCFLFLRNPRGGVEDLDRMHAAGFRGVFCNVGDHQASEWEATIRPRALQLGMVCGPWMRTCGDDNIFDVDRLDALLDVASYWGSPVIVNAESELKGSGSTLTQLIVEKCRGFDAAVSMEPIPFDNVEWWPLGDAGIPVLPQYSSAYGFAGDPSANRDLWHAYGVKCCWPTFGTFGGARPLDYVLNAPYSLYTADDCGGDYAAWSPTAYSYQGCVQQPIPPDGGDMTKIGTQDGVTASMNRLRDIDPAGTLLVKQPNGKWPGIETLTQPVNDWKAYDKLERALTILVEDHDAA